MKRLLDAARLRIALTLATLASLVDWRVQCVLIRADIRISREQYVRCMARGVEHSARMLASEAAEQHAELLMRALRPDLCREES